MQYQTPHEYLRHLKETLQQEHQQLMAQKTESIRSQRFEQASQFNDIEKQLMAFMDALEWKK